MIGDDTGDNISDKNREYCELTGIYWIWKNYDKLGNPDYIITLVLCIIEGFWYLTNMNTINMNKRK